MKIILAFAILWAFTESSAARADCSATSFVFDSQDDFKSENDSFDWCFERVKWWGLSTEDGWRGRFCNSTKYQRGGYDLWTGRFRHQVNHRFKGRNGYDIFNRFGGFYGGRVFKGFNARIEFSFDQRCGGYGINNPDNWDDLPILYD